MHETNTGHSHTHMPKCKPLVPPAGGPDPLVVVIVTGKGAYLQDNYVKNAD